MRAKTIEELNIDPNGLYTVDEAAEMLQQLEPWRPIEHCREELIRAMAQGKLKPYFRTAQ